MSKARKPGRGRPSSVDLLPEDLRVQLNSALRDRRLTQLEIIDRLNALLAERGLQPLSRSAVNRYSAQIEDKQGLMREAREAANAIVGPLEAAGQGDLGRAATELVKALAFDAAIRAKSGEGEPLNVALLGELALILQRIERASKLGVEREAKVAAEAEARAKRAAAKAVDQVGKRKGLTKATVEEIKASILGIRPQEAKA